MRFLPAATAALLLSIPALAEDAGPDEATLGHIKRTQELRGLEFKENPGVKYWSVDELRKMMTEDFDAELPEAKAKSIQDVLYAFGLTPKGYDLRKEYLEVMLEQIAGFYHPKKKLLCLIKGKSGQGLEEETVIVHELNHAMQDQHFDLTRLQDLVAKNDDMTQALKSLIEGEATMVMFDHVLMQQGGMTSDQVPGIEGIIEAQMKASGGAGPQQKLAKAPPVIREGLLGAYIDGFKFCVAVKREGGWEAVNAMWKDVPVSTEQVLHPKKYIERDMPQAVKIPGTFEGLDGWTKVEENVMGEFGVLMVFKTLKPKSEKSGAKASEGWDGDVYRLYEKEGKTLLAWATVWDSETDAKEFSSAYVKAIREKLEGLDDVKADGSGLSHDSGRGWVEIVREGTKVFVVEGGSEAEAKAVSKALMESTTFEEMKPGVGAPEKK
ncbi:MAG: hypothetical protein IT452_02685 [Planctomycetia bacterium]|nr:hypothetical protein [Planctomycetia bacterium]